MRALVIGIGTAGTSCAALLRAQGADVVVADDVAAPLDRLPEVDVVVPSPGVPPRHRLLRQAAARQTPIWSELELASRAWEGPMVAVTATNGKGSVVAMVTDALSRAGTKARAVGNIGDPMAAAVREEPASTVLVVEASSFQLYYCHTFAPDAAAVLNATVDHLDWHPSARAYRSAKGKIFDAQPDGAWAVVNVADPGARALGRRAPGRLCRYRQGRPLPGGIGVSGGFLVADDAAPGGGGRLLEAARLGDKPVHHLDNSMAVFALVRAVAPEATEAAAQAVVAFEGVPHMAQTVAEVAGVTFVDDSKATNPSSAAASIRAHPSVVLVAGGRNKGLPLEAMAVEAARVRAVVGIGESGPEVVRLFESVGVPGEKADGMDDAVGRAFAAASPGDIVLLAPGCASWDMFSGQAARGEAFVAAVRRLEGSLAR